MDQASLVSRHLLARAFDEPLENSIEVGFFFGTDCVTADFAMKYTRKVQRLDELVGRELFRQVGFVSQYKKWDAVQYGLLEQGMKFISRNREDLLIRSVYDITVVPSA